MRRMKRLPASILSVALVEAGLLCAGAQTIDHPPALLNDLVDVSGDCQSYTNAYYVADTLESFDPATASGSIRWVRHARQPRLAFSNMESGLQRFQGNTFPQNEYDVDPVLPFSIEFVSPRTIRVHVLTGPAARPREPSLMLAGDVPADTSWKYSKIDGGHRYTSAAGSITIREKPWHIELRDANGTLLTKTRHTSDYSSTLAAALPFSFIRRTSDDSGSIAAE